MHYAQRALITPQRNDKWTKIRKSDTENRLIRDTAITFNRCYIPCRNARSIIEYRTALRLTRIAIRKIKTDKMSLMTFCIVIQNNHRSDAILYILVMPKHFWSNRPQFVVYAHVRHIISDIRARNVLREKSPKWITWYSVQFLRLFWIFRDVKWKIVHSVIEYDVKNLELRLKSLRIVDQKC